MWQRFLEDARQAINNAEELAQQRRCQYVTADHLLVGLLKEQDSAAVRMLSALGVDLVGLEAKLVAAMPANDAQDDDIMLSHDARHAIDVAYTEARSLGDSNIHTEHLLLGVLQEKDILAAGFLPNMRTLASRVRAEVIRTHVGQLIKRGNMNEKNTVETVQDINSVVCLRNRSLLSISDLTRGEIELILDTAALLKSTIKKDPTCQHSILAGRTLAMIFEKPSLRTRVTFETGMTQLGGHAIYLAPADIQLGVRETVPDVAMNLSRWVDVIMARVFAHSTVKGLAENASIPVINGLCDLEHPCQALADFQTIREHKGDFEGLKLAFIGDGNNVAHSLMLLAAKVGMNFAIACPEGYDPSADIVKQAKEIAAETGSVIDVVRDPYAAVAGADALYTDVWASMGQEAEKEERAKVFAPYQVNQALLNAAKKDAIVLHCLPAHRGEEITAEVLDGPQSVVLDEAENRLHAQKAVLALTV